MTLDMSGNGQWMPNNCSKGHSPKPAGRSLPANRATWCQARSPSPHASSMLERGPALQFSSLTTVAHHFMNVGESFRTSTITS
eukprot:CAMPEP_0178465678 /NCGR_PEP_ID=MMETSP0689_2-20121128/51488_1 /TAXON_ID=160604 /ORGANISM="Amphidinium massartii, Strain CS-259" /LENGTH=82 /DNA_ID=CAMNT_0020092631 /DNA_START=283 /DNA_END=526 /DNA_ORIENTATION=-